LNADVSGDIEGLRLNGVEVATLVEAELNRRDPNRVKMRAMDPVGLSTAWELMALPGTRRTPEQRRYLRNWRTNG
jgi:hypothetical protein